MSRRRSKGRKGKRVLGWMRDWDKAKESKRESLPEREAGFRPSIVNSYGHGYGYQAWGADEDLAPTEYSWERYSSSSLSGYGYSRMRAAADPQAACVAAELAWRHGALGDGRWMRAADPFGKVREGWLQACMELDATGKYGMDPGDFRFPDGTASTDFLRAAWAKYMPPEQPFPPDQLAKDDERDMPTHENVGEHPLPTDANHRRLMGLGRHSDGPQVDSAGNALPLTIPALARAFTAHRERAEHLTDNGDQIARNAAGRLAARMEQGVLSERERAEAAEPAVHLYVDESGSMAGDPAIAATRLGYALAHAARLSGCRATVIGFESTVTVRALPGQLPDLRPHARGGTHLSAALMEHGPALARERGRRIALLLTDGGVDGATTAEVLKLGKAGVEVYMVCLGFEPGQIPELTGACAGAIGCTDPDQITSRVPRELVNVLTKGAAY